MHQISSATEPNQPINVFRVFSQNAAKIDLAWTDWDIWQETKHPSHGRQNDYQRLFQLNDMETAEPQTRVRECNNARRGKKAELWQLYQLQNKLNITSSNFIDQNKMPCTNTAH